MKTLLNELAKLLDAEIVTPYKDNEYRILQTKEHGQIGINKNNDKLCIYRHYPTCPYSGERIDGKTNYKDENPEINVSATKTPEQIAKDIKRRLYPDLLIFEQNTQARIAKNKDYLNEQKRIIKLIKDNGGSIHIPYSYNQETNENKLQNLKGTLKTKIGELTFDLYTYGSIHISYIPSLSIEQLLTIKE